MKLFIEEARLPGNSKVLIYKDSFESAFKNSSSDLTILGLPPTYNQMTNIIDISNNNILFVSSKGMENIFV